MRAKNNKVNILATKKLGYLQSYMLKLFFFCALRAAQAALGENNELNSREQKRRITDN